MREDHIVEQIIREKTKKVVKVEEEERSSAKSYQNILTDHGEKENDAEENVALP